MFDRASIIGLSACMVLLTHQSAKTQDGCISPEDLSRSPAVEIDSSLISQFFDPSTILSGPDIDVTQSDIDYSRVLDDRCSRMINLSGLTSDQYFQALRSGLVLNLLLGLARAREAKSLVSAEGPDRQIVEPRAAISQFGSTPGSSGWRTMVEQEYVEVEDGKSACQLAIEELKGVACGSKHDRECDIEKSYRDQCLNTSNKAKQGACIVAADDYFAHCFGRSNSFGSEAFKSLVPVCDGDDIYCSSSFAFRDDQGRDDRLFVITADHCPISKGVELQLDENRCTDQSLRDERWQREREDLLVVESFREAPLFFPPRGAVPLLLSEDDTDGGITEFRETMVGGVNTFAKARNEIVKLYNENSRSSPANLPARFEPYGIVTWDTSALCTIVELNGWQLKHTCQTASGTSGGPIVQANEGPRLVGIHRGAPETSGAFNIGIPLQQFGEIVDR